MCEVYLSTLSQSLDLIDEPLVQIDLSDFAFERSVGLLLPELVSEQLSGVCICRLENDRLLVAVPEANSQVSQSIELSWGYQCELVEASPEIIQLARQFIYGVLPEAADDETWSHWLRSQIPKSGDLASYLTSPNDDVCESILAQAGVPADGARVDFDAGHLQQLSTTSRGLNPSALRRRLAKSA
jgi:hypothetical protein